MDTEIDYKRIIDCIPPSATNRQQWVQVGMALKHEGQPFELFDAWSAGDARQGQYRGSEYTYKVWESFRESGAGVVTGATLTQLARDLGMDPFPSSGGFFDWGDLVESDGEAPKAQAKTVCHFRDTKKPVFQIIEYLETLFRDDDCINILTSSFEDEEGKRKPRGAGLYSITVSDYIRELRTAADDPDFFGKAINPYDPDAGVWVRINPVSGQLLDGQKAVSDKNVTRYDNALIECDEYSLDEQMRIIKAIGLPYRVLVYSGGKSVHAIIKVGATSLADYKEKVGWLQQYCIANGLPVDTQNSNPSRMSRLPGVQRGDRRQILLETDRNPQSFEEFRKQAQAIEDSKILVIESFADVCDDLPPLAPELIQGVLRNGHKMLISGPSKAGKSFALISLAIAVAEGKEWMGYKAEKGKVLYLNLEIDRPSFWHRMDSVYKAWGWPVQKAKNIEVMNLRGHAEPLSDLAPKLEAVIKRRKYSLVIVDPIYKVITGDENSASDMGKFCNLFDRIAAAGDCAVAYCHHHSKGSQAQKSAIDRASGSGVFARDPDAIVDMTEVGFTDTDREETKAALLEKACDTIMQETGQWANLERVHPEQLKDRVAKQDAVLQWAKTHPEDDAWIRESLQKAEDLGSCPAYRMTMTLREFRSPEPINIFFQYPVHIPDPTGTLDKLYLAGDNSVQTMTKKRVEKTQKRHDKYRDWYDQQRDAGKTVSTGDLARQFDVSDRTARRWANSQDDLVLSNKKVWYEDEIDNSDTEPDTGQNPEMSG